MAKQTVKAKIEAARLRVQRAAARKVRNWAFGVEMSFPEDPDWPITIHHSVTANPRVVRYGTGPQSEITIGKYTGITHSAILLAGGLHRADWVSAIHAFHRPEGWTFAENSLYSKGPIVIGCDVLVAYQAMITSGVTVGHGAIVGTRAVVVKDVEPYSIVGGNPAKHIKFRFDEDTRAALLRIAWWDWPDEKVLALRHEIDSADVAGFIARHDPQRQQ